MISSNVTIRIDKDLKDEAEKLFNDLGLTFSGAINIFIRQAIREQGIPFQISKKSEKISFVDDSTLMQTAKEEINKHFDAYHELAK